MLGSVGLRQDAMQHHEQREIIPCLHTNTAKVGSIPSPQPIAQLSSCCPTHHALHMPLGISSIDTCWLAGYSTLILPLLVLPPHLPCRPPPSSHSCPLPLYPSHSPVGTVYCYLQITMHSVSPFTASPSHLHPPSSASMPGLPAYGNRAVYRTPRCTIGMDHETLGPLSNGTQRDLSIL